MRYSRLKCFNNLSSFASIALNLASVDVSFAGLEFALTTVAGAGAGLKGGVVVFFDAASLFFRIISANPPPLDEGVGVGVVLVKV